MMAEAKTSAPRALGLDALRGLAIIGMCVNGVIGYHGMPAWMYHAQDPPWLGGRTDRAIAGFTWVDLVFPAFIFAMGVAFPFALNGRLDREGRWAVIRGVFTRFAALAAFAIFVQHITPGSGPLTQKGFASQVKSILPGLWSDTVGSWAIHVAMFGFLLLFPMYMRLPGTISDGIRAAVKTTGIVLALSLLWFLNHDPAWASLSPPGYLAELILKVLKRSQIILVVLANMALFGTLIWIATRGDIIMRLAAMAVVAAMLRASVVSGSWVNLLVKSPIVWHPGFEATLPPFAFEVLKFNWIYNFDYLKYLLVLLPGTLVGEFLHRNASKAVEENFQSASSRTNAGALTALAILLTVYVHIALQARWLPTLLPITALAGWAMWMVAQDIAGRRGEILRHLVAWGTFWLVLGLVCEPLDGGIRKSPPPGTHNFSYYFVSVGLSIMLLLALTVWIDFFGRRRWFFWLVENGQNPMVAYVAIRNLIPWAFAMWGMDAAFSREFGGQVIPMTAWAVLKVTLLIAFTCVCTRMKWVWRT